jgi:hypothetical protein
MAVWTFYSVERERPEPLLCSSNTSMARSNSPEALKKLGFTPQSVKEWRERKHEGDRPSGLDDFFRAHQICGGCGGHGTLVTGVRWRDLDGVERSEQGPVAVLSFGLMPADLTKSVTK